MERYQVTTMEEQLEFQNELSKLLSSSRTMLKSVHLHENFTSDSESDGNLLDEDYMKNQPPPYDYSIIKDHVVKIGPELKNSKKKRKKKSKKSEEDLSSLLESGISEICPKSDISQSLAEASNLHSSDNNPFSILGANINGGEEVQAKLSVFDANNSETMDTMYVRDPLNFAFNFVFDDDSWDTVMNRKSKKIKSLTNESTKKLPSLVAEQIESQLNSNCTNGINTLLQPTSVEVVHNSVIKNTILEPFKESIEGKKKAKKKKRTKKKTSESFVSTEVSNTSESIITEVDYRKSENQQLCNKIDSLFYPIFVTNPKAIEKEPQKGLPTNDQRSLDKSISFGAGAKQIRKTSQNNIALVHSKNNIQNTMKVPHASSNQTKQEISKPSTNKTELQKVEQSKTMQYSTKTFSVSSSQKPPEKSKSSMQTLESSKKVPQKEYVLTNLGNVEDKCIFSESDFPPICNAPFEYTTNISATSHEIFGDGRFKNVSSMTNVEQTVQRGIDKPLTIKSDQAQDTLLNAIAKTATKPSEQHGVSKKLRHISEILASHTDLIKSHENISHMGIMIPGELFQFIQKDHKCHSLLLEFLKAGGGLQERTSLFFYKQSQGKNEATYPKETLKNNVSDHVTMLDTCKKEIANHSKDIHQSLDGIAITATTEHTKNINDCSKGQECKMISTNESNTVMIDVALFNNDQYSTISSDSSLENNVYDTYIHTSATNVKIGKLASNKNDDNCFDVMLNNYQSSFNLDNGSFVTTTDIAPALENFVLASNLQNIPISKQQHENLVLKECDACFDVMPNNDQYSSKLSRTNGSCVTAADIVSSSENNDKTKNLQNLNHSSTEVQFKKPASSENYRCSDVMSRPNSAQSLVISEPHSPNKRETICDNIQYSPGSSIVRNNAYPNVQSIIVDNLMQVVLDCLVQLIQEII
ncbi:unnamed protein product [Acanthoscelides obtectus]|uniref:Uncharacterized protein n=1 Tax=Acanthoscelides obtectus TaxID=200917 RepID=A0A9P0KRP8_ACAOB|nr:unnamed protein product [Acanthoscelides obtectus]CAK1647397.1 hypothetical protein AOBTE_LOCUS15210 [Acanthoscelides obtectus]